VIILNWIHDKYVVSFLWVRIVNSVVMVVDNRISELNHWIIYRALLLQGGTLLVAQLVEALHYKSEGRGFDSRRYHWNFSLT
jgi:hypothetical protein